MTGLSTLHRARGRCACGHVSYSCDVEGETALCSCDICCRSSGSAFQGWVNGDLRSLKVTGSTASWNSTDHASRHFCTRCGSALFLFEQGEPLVVEIATGTLDQPDGVTSARYSSDYAHMRPAWSHEPESKTAT